MIKKIWIIIILFFSLWHSSYAINEIYIDSKIQTLENLIEWETIEYKTNLIQYLISEINTRLSQNPNIKNRDNILYFKYNLKYMLSNLWEKTHSNVIVSHSALSLKFIKWENHSSLIQINKEALKKTQSVFIFRGKEDFSRDEMIQIALEIKNINPQILIFIDQEGWQIHRFVDFPSTEELQSILNTFFVKIRMQSMSTESLSTMNSLFDTKKLYFYPSLQDLWKTYNSIQDEMSKKYFLEIAAYIRMNSLKQVWVNTYWLVMDLDDWNPVISWYDRSFSSEILDFKMLINAFILSSEVLEMSLYWKHFPWHGIWDTDSHIWILDISWFPKYTQKNIDVFSYFLSTYSSIQRGIMVGHMYVWNNFINEFNRTLDTANYIITDDLSMQWYLQATGVKKSQSFFSTDTIMWRNNIIRLWNTSSANIK